MLTKRENGIIKYSDKYSDKYFDKITWDRNCVEDKAGIKNKSNK